MSSPDTYAAWRHQPLKALYLSYELAAAFVVVPYWALTALPRYVTTGPPYWALTAPPRSLRPRQSWSWARTMHINMLRHLIDLGSYVGPLVISPSHLALVPGVGYHGVWVDPPQDDLLRGKVKLWASIVSVQPVSTRGTLMPGEKIVYALHGGAYTRLSAHPTDPSAGIAKGILDRVDRVHRTFSIEYRLSSTKPFAVAHPFPTALIDALTGYNYLLQFFAPSDIIVEGDSAGGNLALAFMRYLVETNALPLPGALLLLSPWCDLGNSHVTPESSYFTCPKSDYIPGVQPEQYNYPVTAFTGPFGVGAAEENPYISPASKHIWDVEFTGFPRTFIVNGGAEVLRDSIRTLHERMAKDLGSKVEYFEAEDAVHDFLAIDNGVMEPERGQALGKIGEWVTSLP
ncbi:alpha/beta-hydrolase [Roridomyces roridus]|uniref:Alpha/beta-hydrolase n=1 Tax=Roridomyces roridus TaxID=1738132 RepID=A0AAD7FZ66_9AGAR|nr:alpha/beta-hydrolase [Roridomyces roridus]